MIDARIEELGKGGYAATANVLFEASELHRMIHGSLSSLEVFSDELLKSYGRKPLRRLILACTINERHLEHLDSLDSLLALADTAEETRIRDELSAKLRAIEKRRYVLGEILNSHALDVATDDYYEDFLLNLADALRDANKLRRRELSTRSSLNLASREADSILASLSETYLKQPHRRDGQRSAHGCGIIDYC